jgi:hypothetical protein
MDSIVKFINRAKRYSNKGIKCPISSKWNYGAVGNDVEKILIKDVHRDNKSDMPKLELKTKNINSNNTMSLAKYTNSDNIFNKTFNKFKNNLALIFYYIKSNKIYFDKMILFKKMDKGLYATYLNPIIRPREVNHTISINDLKKIYNKHTIYEYREENI